MARGFYCRILPNNLQTHFPPKWSQGTDIIKYIPGMPEWPIGTDCKSVVARLRRFESSSLDQENMKLFLASEAKNALSIQKLQEYSGGLAGKNIAYIPTAANGEQGWESWRNGGSWELINTLNANISLIQLEEYRIKNLAEVLRGKDIIWVAGGMPGYLMYWMKSTGFDKIIKPLLNTGTLYVGSSAGAMVTSKSLDVATWGFVDNDLGAENMPGLGLVDFDIYPHYEDSLYEQIKSKFKGNKIYLLKNGEEIIVEDGNIQVIGEERIITG